MFDPRTHLMLVLYGAVLVVASPAWEILAAEWAVLFGFILVIRKQRVYGRWLRLVLPMSIFFGAVTAWSAGGMAGWVAGLKLLTLTTAFFTFFTVTPPEDLSNALIRMGLPYSAAFITSTAMQFVPIIVRKAKAVIAAQQARGIPLEPGWSAFRHYPAFLGPLLIQSFQLAEELAEAMEARGFGRAGRTFYLEYRLRLRDYAAMGIGLALTAAGLYFLI